MISISIVSHGQFALVKDLLADLEKYCTNSIEVILTLNIPEEIPATLPYHFPMKIIKNNHPKGFGANHNQAFRKTSGDYFCVLNPDIRLLDNPFPSLIKTNPGVSAPKIDDNAREFLTPFRLIKRVFKKTAMETTHPDWVAGMFMVFPRTVYEAINGFDERYFLYCEDMDICWRLRKAGYAVHIEKNAAAIHAAQRDSHKKLKHLYWHLKSLCIYFILHPMQLIK
ncbi:MAG: glycosyltransferase family 2 protein [Gammaproteobacteria bacterium]|nr:glycosyltransferase family 2 protein [Gammaproteobacteria bacterium]